MSTARFEYLVLCDPRLHWLHEIAQPPERLFYKGDPSVLSRPAIAVVGTRRPSSYGVRAAFFFARAMASFGFVVVSGLARGIDSAAHRGALLAQGTTVAVLGHGLDRIYPALNRGLAQQIFAQGGCLISEYAASVPALKHHFPARNRLIAGLSLGTLVIEAAPRSGSLITARLALDQNREVFAVASVFDDKGFAGSHELLQQGAKLVTRPEDLLAELPIEWIEKAARFRPQREGDVAFNGDAGIAHAFQNGRATLQSIIDSCQGDRERALRGLELAASQRFIVEMGPQEYLWIGSSGEHDTRHETNP